MEADLQGEEGELDELGGEEDDAKTALQSVIDLLMAQADAQKAEANAKEAEANAEEAKHNAGAADAKVKQEEQVLDMEAYYDEQGKADKEAKQLSKLAKWKHETAQTAQNEMSGTSGDFTMPEDTLPEEEDEQLLNVFDDKAVDADHDRKLQPGEFIKYMFRSVQGN